MTQPNIEWMQSKAEEMLRNQVEQIAKSEYPASDLVEGMVEMAYGTGLLSDARYEYWKHKIDLAVKGRRQELRNGKHAALLAMPALAGGDLITGVFNGNG